MAEHTGISYLDATWNVTTGCTHASAGCDRCWAEGMACRKAANPVIRERADFGEVLTDGRWNGQVRLLENRLDWPLKWKKPKVVGVCFESDLFHEAVPDSFIHKVIYRMAQCQQHTFVLLTKRPARMCAMFQQDAKHLTGMPLPNVWIGVTVENQARADERIPLLLQTPAAHRWISYEPALAPVDFARWLPINLTAGMDFDIDGQAWPGGKLDPDRQLSLVVVGCESGPGARPMDLQWAKRAIDQCDAAGVAVYFKQQMVANRLVHLPEYDGKRYDRLPWAGELIQQVPAAEEGEGHE